jgi:hypothetical protein
MKAIQIDVFGNPAVGSIEIDPVPPSAAALAGDQ